MLKYFHVNTFTTLPLKGNPAGVILNADKLTTEEMQGIARDLSLPETVFVRKPSHASNAWALRWFSPKVELTMSGHGTLAAIHVLQKERMLNLQEGFLQVINLEYPNGILPVHVSKTNGTDPSIWIGLPVPVLEPFGGAQEDIFRYLGITDNDIDSRLPIMKADKRLIIIPVLGLLTLRKVAPQFEKLRKVLEDDGLIGVATFSRETVKQSANFHSRFFSPNLGNNEDPVTGLVNGVLATYWIRNVMPMVEDRNYQFIGEQGDAINREGEVRIQAQVKGRQVTGLEIGGFARIFLQGTLEY